MFERVQHANMHNIYHPQEVLQTKTTEIFFW